MVIKPQVLNKLMTTPSIGNNVLQPVGGCQEEDVVSRARGKDNTMTRTSDDTYHADMRTNKESSPRPEDTTGVLTPRGDTAMVAPSIGSVSDEYTITVDNNHHVDTANQGAVDPGVTSPISCTYKKGICNIHERGAKLGWRQVTKTIVGPERRMVTRDTRKCLWVLGGRG